MASDYLDYVTELLSPLGSVRAKSMFGGIGVYIDSLFCALIVDDCLYFKGDDDNEADYLAAGCEPFTYIAKGVTQRLRYYRVPDEALDNPQAIASWARLGMAAALRKANKSANKRSSPTSRKPTTRKAG
ncbi:MAG: TfoX/Sxy family protein [Burkholderiaceae bacterium]|nr:TfoX/Sxy family protein [Burkholderiaceae bacterium]